MRGPTTFSGRRAFVALLAAVGVAWAGPVVGAEQQKEETDVETYEAKNKKERPERENTQDGPKQLNEEEFIAEKKFKGRKAADRGIKKLQELLESTSKGDAKRAEYLFNLAELYWDKSKFYEQKAFKKQDQCYAYEEAGKKKKFKRCKRRKKRMLKESDRLRNKAVSKYKKIISNHPNFKEMDKVLFYLANNLDKAGKKEEAVEIYEQMLTEFPNSDYHPNVLLAMGEYYFNEKENPKQALTYYKKVQAYPDSSVYSYARYKAGWCHFNMQNKDKALQIFLDVLKYARKHPNQPNASSLIDQTLNDIVKTYAAVGEPGNAIPFFTREAQDKEKALEMAESLAIKYASDAKYQKSNKMYRALIKEKENSWKIIDYQYEIVRNYTSENAYRKKTIKELIKLMRLVERGTNDDYENMDEEKFKEAKNQVSELVRQWSTRFHREAKVTKNPNLYVMAYNLYKNFLRTFPDNKHNYEMGFYNAEVLYQLEYWNKAAKWYHKVLEMKEDGEYTKQAAHAQVLALFKVVNTSKKEVELDSAYEYKKAKDKTVDEEKSEKNKDENKDGKKKEREEITEDQKRLLEACKTYIEKVPDGKDIVDARYTMGRIYFEHNHLEKARKRFKEIAFKHSDHDLAKVAANLHLSSLLQQDDFEKLKNVVSEYKKKQPIDDDEFKSAVNRLYREIRFKLCRESAKAEKWRKTANCYVEYYRDFPNSDIVDTALYNAALAFERIKELGKAIRVRKFLLEAKPNSNLAPKTVYRIGGNYQALAVYSQSANFYEKFIRIYPDMTDGEKAEMEDHRQKAEKALAHASTFRQGLGQLDKAIENFRKYLELFGNRQKHHKKAADIAFQIAEVYKEKGEPRKAMEQYRTYLQKWADKGTDDRRLQAHVRIGLYYWNHDERDVALEKFEETLDLYNNMSEKRQKEMVKGRDAAAQAKFMIAEDVNDEMVSIGFEGINSGNLSKNEEKMQEIFKEKLEIAKKAKGIYEEVIQFERPDWAIAALFKIGSQFQNFANTIRNSPVPDRLTYRQKELYRGMLEDRAKRMGSTAVSAYKRAIGLAKKHRWFNDYSRKAEVRLSQLRPGEYGEPAEMRARPEHLREGYTRSGFIEKLEIDQEQLKDLGGSGGGDQSNENKDGNQEGSKESAKKSKDDSSEADES